MRRGDDEERDHQRGREQAGGHARARVHVRRHGDVRVCASPLPSKRWLSYRLANERVQFRICGLAEASLGLRGVSGCAKLQRRVGSGRTVPIEMPRAKGRVLRAMRVRGEVVIDFWWRAVVTTLARRNIPARLSREVRPPAAIIVRPPLDYSVQYRVGLCCSLLSRLQALEFAFAVSLETSHAIATTPEFISQHAPHLHLHLLRRRHTLTRATRAGTRVPSHDTTRRRTL
jgi:hypothetical protein